MVTPLHSHQAPGRCRQALGLLLLLIGVAAAQAAPDARSLAGRWRFALDREDVGLSEGWAEKQLAGSIQLPGSLPAQGVGDEITLETPWVGSIVDRSFFTAPEYAKYRTPGQIKVPFWLQPETYYAGAAWYQREFEIPDEWAGQRVLLTLERPHWETQVWVDDGLIGTNTSLSTPHEHDLGPLSVARHILTIRVDNRLIVDVGRDSHSVSDHTQGNWNGIVGKIELRPIPNIWLEDVQVFTHIAPPGITVRGQVWRTTNAPTQAFFDVQISRPAALRGASQPGTFRAQYTVALPKVTNDFTCDLPMPGADLWDEFHPALYDLTASVQSNQTREHRRIIRFGLREFRANGTQFAINGRNTFLRGTLECCIFPKTGHPPTDLDSWRRIIRTAKAFGLNNIRFHSWCPPEAAFAAADELGFYLHVECASWANASTTLGDGKPIDTWIYEEADRILRAYGNHPSFVLMLYGNEPGGKRHEEFLRSWVEHYKGRDPRRLYSSGAGWPQLAENQFHVTPDPRIQAWGGGLKSRINALPPETCTDYRSYIAARKVPVMSHEIGQWCVYPNFDEMRKYTGYLKPRNFEIFRDHLEAHGLGDFARRFLHASGKLQTLCYKEDIESALRTPGMAGFQLLDLHDFPGQGTALVGVLDPFWEEKGYVTASEFHRFCGPTVPLARLSKRVFTQNEETSIPLEVAHFGPERLEKVWPVYKFVDEGGRVFEASCPDARTVEVGNGQSLGLAQVHFGHLPAPARYRFVLGLARAPRGGDLLAENDWDVWVYPDDVPIEIPPEIVVVHELSDTAIATLKAGGKVLWLLPPTRVAPDKQLGPIALGFSSIFWNTAWTRHQAPHTLGILCDPKHPLLAQFPTDDHSNWQWWYLVTRANPIILDELSPRIDPVVQVIDDWFTARKLGLVFECKVETGRLLVCSLDLETDLANNPVARQFRASLVQYLNSTRFEPKIKVALEPLRNLQRGTEN